LFYPKKPAEIEGSPYPAGSKAGNKARSFPSPPTACHGAVKAVGGAVLLVPVGWRATSYQARHASGANHSAERRRGRGKVVLAGGTSRNRRQGPSRGCFRTPMETTFSMVETGHRRRQQSCCRPTRAGAIAPKEGPQHARCVVAIDHSCRLPEHRHRACSVLVADCRQRNNSRYAVAVDHFPTMPAASIPRVRRITGAPARAGLSRDSDRPYSVRQECHWARHKDRARQSARNRRAATHKM